MCMNELVGQRIYSDVEGYQIVSLLPLSCTYLDA